MSNLFERTKPSPGPRILLSLLVAIAGLGAGLYFISTAQEEEVTPQPIADSLPEVSSEATGRTGEPIDWRTIDVGDAPSDCGADSSSGADVTLAIIYRMGPGAVGEFAIRNTGDRPLYYHGLHEAGEDCPYAIETLRNGAWEAGEWTPVADRAVRLEIEPGETTLVRASLDPSSDTLRVAFGVNADSALGETMPGRTSHVHSDAFMLLKAESRER